MQTAQTILLAATAFYAFGLVSRRLRDTPLTAPMFFTGLERAATELGNAFASAYDKVNK